MVYRQTRVIIVLPRIDCNGRKSSPVPSNPGKSKRENDRFKSLTYAQIGVLAAKLIPTTESRGEETQRSVVERFCSAAEILLPILDVL